MSLLDELDAADCWCGRTEGECEEAGGCRWTRALTALRRESDAQLESLRQQNAALSEALGEAEERTPAARGIDYFLDQIAGSLTAHAGQPVEVRDLATSLRRKAAALRGSR